MSTVLWVIGGLIALYALWGANNMIKRKKGAFDTYMAKKAKEENKDLETVRKEILKADGKIVIISIIIAICLFAAGFAFQPDGLFGESGGTSTSTATCQVCGRSWSAGDSGGNFRSISRTHMCVNCYNNYQYSQKMLGR